MDGVRPQVSPDQSNGSLEASEDDSHDLSPGKSHINQPNSSFSDESKGFLIALDRPKIPQGASALPHINQEEEVLDLEPQDASPHSTAYVRPRVRISQDEKSLDEIEFSGDENDYAAPSTPAKLDKRFIDTSAPFESVKDAVSKFGGTVDWKTQRSQSMEKSRSVDQELEKAQEDIPLVKQQTEATEEAKAQVLKDLEATNRLIEEVKLNLEKAQAEEQQAKQDSELAKMRVKEMEQGIANKSSVDSKEELDVVRAKQVAAVSELTNVKEELQSLKEEYSSLLNNKEAALKKAEEALSASKEIEKTVEEMNKELVSTKESLEYARAAHLEAEEQKNGAVMASEQDILAWDKELKQGKEDMEKLNQQVQAEKDLKAKLNSASVLLADLKSELAAYTESKSEREANGSEKKNHDDMQAAVVAAKNELEELKNKTEKTKDEVNSLKVVAVSLKTELEHEKSKLINLKQREGMASVAVASLEAELERIKLEMATVQTREKEAKGKLVELPKQLQLAAQEADEAKSAAEAAREKLRKVKEEAEQAKAGASTVETRLVAAQKEIEAARASEKLAMDSIKALRESESTRSNNCGDRSDRVAIPLEEYYELSKRAQEAEEQANTKAAAAMAQIEAAKEAEAETLGKLEEANQELLTRKEVYDAASNKAAKANEAKLSVEQELRTWRAENEQRRKAGDGVVTSPRKSIEEVGDAPAPAPASHEQGQGQTSSELVGSTALSRIATSPKGLGKSDSGGSGTLERSTSADTSPDVKAGKKKKRSFFPRFLMFFSKKKTSSKT